jgi:hypothetical protein
MNVCVYRLGDDLCYGKLSLHSGGVFEDRTYCINREITNLKYLLNDIPSTCFTLETAAMTSHNGD